MTTMKLYNINLDDEEISFLIDACMFRNNYGTLYRKLTTSQYEFNEIEIDEMFELAGFVYWNNITANILHKKLCKIKK